MQTYAGCNGVVLNTRLLQCRLKPIAVTPQPPAFFVQKYPGRMRALPPVLLFQDPQRLHSDRVQGNVAGLPVLGSWQSQDAEVPVRSVATLARIVRKLSFPSGG